MGKEAATGWIELAGRGLHLFGMDGITHSKPVKTLTYQGKNRVARGNGSADHTARLVARCLQLLVYAGKTKAAGRRISPYTIVPSYSRGLDATTQSDRGLLASAKPPDRGAAGRPWGR